MYLGKPWRGYRAGYGVIALALVLACAVGLIQATPLVAQFPPEVRGVVVDEATRAPIPGVRVEVAASSLQTITRVDGSFILRGLLPGPQTIRVAMLGFRGDSLIVNAENGRVRAVHIVLRAESISLPELRVAANEAQFDLPGTSLLDRGAIEGSQARDLADLLETVPGVTVTRRGGAGSSATASIRGSSASQVLVLLDGVPLNSVLTGEVDLSTVLLNAVEEVRVLPGSESARFGAGALGGVISLKTRSSVDGDLTVALGTGSFGERAVSVAAAGGSSSGSPLRTSDWTGSLAGEWRDYNGDFRFDLPAVRGGGRATRENGSSSLLSLSGNGRWERGAAQLQARLSYFDLDRGMPGSIVQSSPTGQQSQTRTTLAVSASGGTLLRWSGAVDGQQQSVRFDDSSPPSGAAFHDTVDVWSLGLNGTASLSSGPVLVDVGIEGRSFEVQATSLSEDAPTTQNTLGTWVSGQVTREWKNGLTGSLTTGARADWHTHVDGLTISPSVGFTLASSKFATHLTISRSFSPPSFADQFFQEGVLVRPNPGLEPERVRREFEAGIAIRGLTLGPITLETGVDGFWSDVEGLILWFPDFQFIWSPENFDVERKGLEGRLSAILPEQALSFDGQVSAVWLEYTGPVLDGQVVYRPRWTGSGSLAKQLGSISARLEAQRIGARRTVPGSALNTLEPYWLTHLQLSTEIALGDWVGTPNLAVRNLLNHSAAMLVDYPFPGRSWNLEFRLRRENGA